MENTKPVKIALFVEDEVDKTVIDTFVKKMLSSSTSVDFFRKRPNLAAFHSSYIDIAQLLSKGYQHFFLLFEVNTSDKFEINRTITMLSRPLKENGVFESVTFCPIVPNLNAWLLDHYQLPKKEFGQEFDLPKIQEIANQIDMNVLKQKNASFAQFAHALQQWNVQKMAA
jgi:hypothetical protein